MLKTIMKHANCPVELWHEALSLTKAILLLLDLHQTPVWENNSPGQVGKIVVCDILSARFYESSVHAATIGILSSDDLAFLTNDTEDVLHEVYHTV